MIRARLLFLSITLFIFAGGNAYAHGSLGRAAETDIAAMAEAANLVVIARIDEVKYVNVPIKGEQNSIPNGLVTISILNTLRGKAPGKTMLLRFVGGSDGRGGILNVNGVPMFEAGETNVLFIADNGNEKCPLVNCEWGRFRVHKDAVYNTHGSPVLSITKGHVVARGLPPKELTIIRFPAPTFDDVMQNPVIKERFSQMGMTYEEGKARYEREAPKFIEYGLNIPTVLETAEPIDEPIPPEIKDEMKVPLNDQGAQSSLSQNDLTMMRRAPVKRQTGPMSLKPFASEISKIIAGVKRPPEFVQSIDPSEDYQLPSITPLEAPQLEAGKPVLQQDSLSKSEAEDPLQGAGLESPDGAIQKNKKPDGKSKPQQ